MGKIELLQGTLDMLVLRTLCGGPLHGWGIAQRISVLSNNTLLVEEGSLYPSLYRMEQKAWIQAEWGLTERKRRAKFYELTAAGRAQLELEEKNWGKLITAIGLVMGGKQEASRSH